MGESLVHFQLYTRADVFLALDDIFIQVYTFINAFNFVVMGSLFVFALSQVAQICNAECLFCLFQTCRMLQLLCGFNVFLYTVLQTV